MTTLQRAEAAEHALSQELDRVVVKSVIFTSGERDPRQPVSRPPDDMRRTADIVGYGSDVRQRLVAWWAAKPDKSGRETVQTYYGPQTLHEYLERSTWHSGQHVRQWVMLLGRAGITADRPPGPADFADLPMPSQVWDG